MSYDKSSHTVFHHRYHVVWITKYRFKVLRGALRERVRDIVRQVCREMGVTIIKGVLSNDHVHLFVSIPQNLSVSRSCSVRSSVAKPSSQVCQSRFLSGRGIATCCLIRSSHLPINWHERFASSSTSQLCCLRWYFGCCHRSMREIFDPSNVRLYINPLAPRMKPMIGLAS